MGKPAFNAMEILQEKRTMTEDRFSMYLNETKFPGDRLSDEWKNLAKLAKKKIGPVNMALKIEEYEEVFERIHVADVDNLSFFEFGCISNATEALSFGETGLSWDDYKKVIHESVTHIKFYLAETNKMRDQIGVEVEKELAMKITALQGKNILTPIKGEA